MNAFLTTPFGPASRSSPWHSTAPVREELFGIERLEQHAQSLATAQTVSSKPPRVISLHRRLKDNAGVLRVAYDDAADAAASQVGVVPAAQWLLDNYHLVEQQVREVREDLPAGYYRQLPKLATGPFAGYPRVFGLAWAFVAHTDSHFDPQTLRRFIDAYQRVQPLTIGELWAVAITLRIVLIENLRRLTDQINVARLARADAECLADRLFAVGCEHSALDTDIASRDVAPLSELFAAHLAKRLRDKDPSTTPALAWLIARLNEQQSTIEQAVSHAQQRQGASNLSVRNIINSMRSISAIDWAQLFEDVSLVDACLRASSPFASMDFATRNLYRSAVEQLARGAPHSELEIVQQALLLGSAAVDSRAADPGYLLIAEGRPALEAAIGFCPSPRLRVLRWHRGLGVAGYAGSIMLLTVAMVAVTLNAMVGVPMLLWVLLAALGALPASELASSLVNRAVARSFGAVTLPGLEMLDGVPSQWRSLVVVPTLLGSQAQLLGEIEQLEVHYLSGTGGDLCFALLVDGADAAEQVMAGDVALLLAGRSALALLNQRYPAGASGPRFLLLYRERRYNLAQGCWMGWERKRGKLHELNRLLRGETGTSFGDPAQVPAGVRFVITLDADTRLPRDAAQRLVGKLAHPLNRPRLSPDGRRVVTGYGILQPRVTPSLPLDGQGSLYQQLCSSPGGMDPYVSAASDVYQDLFGEGSYTGKGIYDVDAFEAALRGRVADNSMLSHDLFEGIFARAGLVSEIEVVESFPPRFDVDARRQHRWTRGDWQLLPTLVEGSLPALGYWKIFDNLRRSLVAPATFCALLVSWLLPLPMALLASVALLSCSAVPVFLPTLLGLLSRRPNVRWASHGRKLGAALRLACVQFALNVALLPDQSWRMTDAIARTLYRLGISRRNLLQWTTAAQTGAAPSPTLGQSYRRMLPGCLLAISGCVWVVALSPQAWPLALPLLTLWLGAPAIAFFSSRPSGAEALPLTVHQADELRLVARRTWRYFETFVTAQEHHLPPDNFQEDPKAVIAHRTSPTNMGLYLLATASARDLGWLATAPALARLETTLAVMEQLPRFRGHLFNWYDTRDLRALQPSYVSAVDSGNLAGHLIALANTCEEWARTPAVDPCAGLRDTLHLAVLEVGRLPALVKLQSCLSSDAPFAQQASEVLAGLRELHGEYPKAYWLSAFRLTVAEHLQAPPADLPTRLQALADRARAMAMGMDFAFLMNPERGLLAIGYRVDDHQLDSNCYDLLASEARLSSLFAIAKGDVPSRHWSRLGRTATPVGKGCALISWSGSMFEYLMPSLVMRAPATSLLAETQHRVVERQQAYSIAQNMPWGISESAYNARDIEFTYQYSNFGVPGLGLKRGLADDRVIAPYATALAAMVDGPGACANLATLTGVGAMGQYGYYEAVDFTASRVPEGAEFAIVRNYMAHHQGMTIVAIANVLLGGLMRERFHREPMIQACELLLQERAPTDVMVAPPRAEHASRLASDTLEARGARQLQGMPVAAPICHVLSNGRYSVMLTGAGTGYSRWRDLAVTRWREDPVLDPWGSFMFVQDLDSGRCWSATGRSTQGVYGEVTFAEDHAEFSHRQDTVTTNLTVLVSGEDDSEVRHLTLANNGAHDLHVALTSYTELVLASGATDTAHPAFAKLFVVTEYWPEYGALVATRRPRAPGDPIIWAAHFAVSEATLASPVQYETDRARFLGRNRELADAMALQPGVPLSGTVGTVLDPVFALRHSFTVAPDKPLEIAFWTVVADSREALQGLIDKHHEHSAFERARTLAWTQAQVQLRHLAIEASEAADFQSLIGALLYADPIWRASPMNILRGTASQAGLWPMGISGDLPIVLLLIDDSEDLLHVRQLLLAHEYWRMKRLSVDLVILNERGASYQQDLQVAVETAVRSSQARPGPSLELSRGSVYTLRTDLLQGDSRALLLAVARIVLRARTGGLREQILARPTAQPMLPAPRWTPPREVFAPASDAAAMGLEFFNGLGGFGAQGREYVTVLDNGARTPAPWINVVANPGFGFQVAADGSGYTWAANSRENQLTPWSNDPVADRCGEALYVRDNGNGVVSGPCAWPVRDSGRYIARHGFGYSRFEHTANEIAMSLLQYVPLRDPLKVSRLTLHNLSDKPRHLSVFTYVEWVLGTSRAATAAHLTGEVDARTGAMLARNPWATGFAGCVAFSDLASGIGHWSSDRLEFIGRRGSLAAPAALAVERPLSGAGSAGTDPCAAQQHNLLLAPGQSIELMWLVGQATSLEAAQRMIMQYRHAPRDAVLEMVHNDWRNKLGAVQVKTPDRALDVMLNGWLLYQTLACRIWARAAFYQASGAYGLRDQLQDGLALSFAAPELTREHLLRAAARQFPEGDLQHWWLPHSGQGVRTRISDDRAWLAHCTAVYVDTSGDVSVLDEQVNFVQGPPLKADETDHFFTPEPSEHRATLYAHCALALEQSLEHLGDLGLPLIGSGDWNDGMNRVGEQGSGQSVWLGWLLLDVLERFIPLAKHRDLLTAERWQAHYLKLQAAMEACAWDGQWYRRATFDDGSWLGSAANTECRIDSIAQSWAVLSGAARPERAQQAMTSLGEHLVRDQDRLALLFTPPFAHSSPDPGYLMAYPPGLRENGGQYSHAAMWAVLAYARQDRASEALALFNLLNPINHGLTPSAVQRYKVEPYVIAADVYSQPPHVGRGGWTWYTGSASWMYRAGLEGILGTRRQGAWLYLKPRLATHWAGFELEVNALGGQLRIRVQRRTDLQPCSLLDSEPLEICDGEFRLPLDGAGHDVLVVLTVPGQ